MLILQSSCQVHIQTNGIYQNPGLLLVEEYVNSSCPSGNAAPYIAALQLKRMVLIMLGEALDEDGCTA